jgi:hypothetical protein
LLDGSEAVLYEGKRLRYVVLWEPAPRAERGEELLSQRQYVAEQERKVWKPPADHPWRRSWKVRGSVIPSKRLDM